MKDREELIRLLEYIHSDYGYDLTEYSEASVKRCIGHFMNVNRIGSVGELGRILKEGAEFEKFIQEVTVTVTEMFRDTTFYRSLRERVIARLATYPFIKIWIAGSSTGEEAYSVAILLKEAGLLERSVIYVTDINRKALQAAENGIYPVGKMRSYAENYIKAGGQQDFSGYYKVLYDSVIMDSDLKHNMVFSVHNLAVDRSFNEFQLILCRNVLIYFNRCLQDKVIDLFYDSLCPFGFLALGNKESLLFSGKEKKFGEIDRKEKIFIKAE